jgi:hypothetical protein
VGELSLELGLDPVELLFGEAGQERLQALGELLDRAHVLLQARDPGGHVSTAAEDDAGALVWEGAVLVSGVGQGFGGDLEGQKLVGLGTAGGHRHDAEGGGVEADLLAEEAAALAVHAVEGVGVGVVEHVLPAALGNVGDGIEAAFEVTPEGLQIGRSREATGHPDDGDAAVLFQAVPT